MALVYGQMNEPPGARARVGLTGLTVAEYFRDQEGQDVLFFVDNIFRFTQAGSEVSALLGRIPSAVGYQPTLGTDMGALQERITSTKKGSITSVQAIYVPADDLTDPAPATSFAHLDATTVLSRGRSPSSASTRPSTRSTRPRASSTPRSSARSTTRWRGRCRRCCSATRRSRTSSPSSAWTSCRKRTSWSSPARARSSASSASRSTSPRCSPARPGMFVQLEDTIKGFKGIVDGDYDDLPEAAFYMVGAHRGGGREGQEAGAAARRPEHDRRQGRVRARGAGARLLASVDADMVVVPGSEGDFGVLPSHAPLISLLRPGVISIYQGDQVDQRVFVAGGFAEVNERGCTVLAEDAEPFEQVTAEQLAERERVAREELSDAATDAEKAAAQKEPRRCQGLAPGAGLLRQPLKFIQYAI